MAGGPSHAHDCTACFVHTRNVCSWRVVMTMENVFACGADSDALYIGGLIAQSAHDMAALETLYTQFKREVFAFCLSIVRDFSLAEECVQEVFTRLPKAAGRLKEPEHGKTFLLALAKNTAREMLRAQPRTLRLEEYVCAGTEDFTRASEVAHMLDALTADQRQVVVLHVYNRLTFDEIARLLRRPASTIKSRYTRARQILEKEWNITD